MELRVQRLGSQVSSTFDYPRASRKSLELGCNSKRDKALINCQKDLQGHPMVMAVRGCYRTRVERKNETLYICRSWTSGLLVARWDGFL